MKRTTLSSVYPPTSVHEALRSAIKSLQAAHVESASLDARLLLQHVLGISHEQWIASNQLTMSHDQEVEYQSLVARRVQREPITHLTGRREFWGMDFKVTAATLDPRPDSETLVESVLRHVPDRNKPLTILDLGTGTGCLLISLVKELPQAYGTGVDLSRDAIEIAKTNARQLDVESRAQFLHGNWCEHVDSVFDIVISNPPYIPSGSIPSLAPEVAKYEPKLALDGGADGLACYRDIMAVISHILKPEAIAAFEIGMGQAEQVTEIAESHGLKLKGVSKDMQGIVRCVMFESANQ